MRLFVLESDALVSDRTFGEQAILIGSDADCTMTLRDAAVAPRHVRLAPGSSGDWEVEVLDRLKPTRLNGEIVSGTRKVRDHDEIGVGPFLIRVYLSLETRTAGAGARSTSAERESPLPHGSIVRVRGGIQRLPIERLAELAGLTTDLSGIAQTERLLERVLREAAATFRASTAGISLRRRTATSLETFRAVGPQGGPVETPALMKRLHERCTRSIYEVCLPDAGTLGSVSAMAVPLVSARGAILGMLYVESGGEARYDTTTLDLLSCFAAAVAAPLECAVRGETREHSAALDHAHTLARQVQDQLTVRAMPEWSDIQVAALRRPGSARPRDLYDLLRLANRTVAILLAQVCAQGAALPRLMAEVRAAFRAACLHADGPHVLARTVNWLAAEAHADWSVELACVWVPSSDDTLRYCVAGQGLSLAVVDGAGSVRALEACGMPPIGRAKGFAYTQKSGSLANGETLVLVTDGAEHLRSAAGAAFGRAATIACLRESAGLSLNQALSELSAEWDDHVTGGQALEDATVVLAQRRG